MAKTVNTNKNDDNMRFYNQNKEVPADAQKPIKGGRISGYTDINPQWRIECLTEMFGPIGFGWYYKKTSEKVFDGANGEKVVSIDINLFIKDGGEWSQPIEGSGGAMLVAKEKYGLYTDDEAIKKATTDAISVACKQIGIGGDIYRNKKNNNSSSKYTDKKAQTKAQQSPVSKANEVGEEAGDDAMRLVVKWTLADVVNNNVDKFKEKLQVYTSFTNKEGKLVKGTDDYKSLKGKQLNVVYGAVKRDYPKQLIKASQKYDQKLEEKRKKQSPTNKAS